MIKIYNPEEYTRVFGSEPYLVIKDNGYIYTKAEYERLSRTACGYVNFEKGLIYGPDYRDITAKPIATIVKKSHVTEIRQYDSFLPTVMMYIKDGKVYSPEEYKRVFSTASAYIKDDRKKPEPETTQNTTEKRTVSKHSTGGGGGGGGGAATDFNPIPAIAILFFGIVVVSAILSTTFGQQINMGIYYRGQIYDILELALLYCAAPAAAVILLGWMVFHLNKVRRYVGTFVFMLLFGVAAIAAISFVMSYVLDYSGYGIEGKHGLKLYFCGYAPLLIYAIIGRIIMWFRRNAVNVDECYEFCKFAVLIVLVIGLVMIVVGRVGMYYLCFYILDGSLVIFMRLLWHGLLATIFGICVYRYHKTGYFLG